MILTSIGEIGVHVEGRAFLLRPSLFAMSQLGSPTEIVQTFAEVMGDDPSAEFKKRQAELALSVVYACVVGDDDISEVFGYYSGGEKGGFVRGVADPSDTLHLARCLLKHGITGALPPEDRGGEGMKYSPTFDAREQVALAMAHLGVSEKDAWNMTMTSLVGALRAKFPYVKTGPGSNAPTKEEHEATMEWFERVEEKRKKKQGTH